MTPSEDGFIRGILLVNTFPTVLEKEDGGRLKVWILLTVNSS